ncbi:MAG: histidine kinase dimerization/phospho-acceptor domain-containing protein [Chitinivibrionales bacterium]|nr:histidine kinase dimerization/phospho-acceptor domain-containing protein [Chitinivibrionales bacterium]
MRIPIAIKVFAGFLIVILLNLSFVVIVSRLYDLTIIVTILKRQNDIKNQLLVLNNLNSDRKRSQLSYTEIHKPESVENFRLSSNRVKALLDSITIQLDTIVMLDSTVSDRSIEGMAANSATIAELREVMSGGVKKHNLLYVNSFAELATPANAAARPDPKKMALFTAVIDTANQDFTRDLKNADARIDALTKYFIYDIDQRIGNAKRLTVIILIAMPIMALLIGLLFSTAITTSLRRLKESARYIGKGNFDFNPTGYPQDEIGDLANAFFTMAVDLKNTQEELVRSKRLAAIGEVVASVNHEINNPLMIISGNAQFLEMSMENFPDELKDRVKAILEETERISAVTRKLREIKNPVVEDYTSSGEQMINLDKSSLNENNPPRPQ